MDFIRFVWVSRSLKRVAFLLTHVALRLLGDALALLVLLGGLGDGKTCGFASC